MALQTAINGLPSQSAPHKSSNNLDLDPPSSEINRIGHRLRPRKELKDSQVTILVALLTAVFFAVDIATPLGVADSVLYVTVILVAFFSQRKNLPFYLASLCTALTIAGYWLSPPGGEEWKVLANRGLSIYAVWVTAGLTYLLRHAAEKRWESDTRIHALIDGAADGILTFNDLGRIESVNQACESLFHLPTTALLCQPVGSLWAQREREPWEKWVQQLRTAKTGEFLRAEREITGCAMTGREIPLLVAVSSLTVGGKRMFTAILHDITGRKQHEALLARALAEGERERNHLEAIIGSLTDPLVATDEKGGISLFNQAAERLFICDPAKVTGMRVSQAFGPGPLADYFHGVTSGEDGQEPKELKIVQEGKILYLHPRTRTFEIPAEQGEGQVTVLRDITQERLINQLKSEIISTAAHELSTPLTTIMGYSEILLNEKEFGEFTDEQHKEFLDEINRKCAALSLIVEEMLDISRIESGKGIPFHLHKCGFNRILHQVVKRHQDVSSKHRLELSLPGLDAELWLDPGKMEQVVENLLSNAVKYSPSGGTIRIEARILGSDYEFSVSDEGIGMTEDQVSRMFEKFYRADASNTAVGGVGLGMSVVKAIIDGHKGSIAVESRLGAGTRVSVRLPLQSDGNT